VTAWREVAVQRVEQRGLPLDHEHASH
jgi:hypothetical protein